VSLILCLSCACNNQGVKVIRPRILGYAVAGAAAISLLAIGSTVFTGTFVKSMGGLCLLAAFDILVWLFFVEPKVRFDSNHVEIRNPLRVLKASWAAVSGFETKFGLSVVTEHRKFVAWSAPAPSRREAGRIRSSELKGTELQGQPIIEPGHLETSESGSLFGQLKAAKDSSKNLDQTESVSLNLAGVAGIAAALLLTYLSLHL
jgi:hypothetical protein